MALVSLAPAASTLNLCLTGEEGVWKLGLSEISDIICLLRPTHEPERPNGTELG